MKEMWHIVRGKGLEDYFDNVVKWQLRDINLAEQCLAESWRDAGWRYLCRYWRGIAACRLWFNLKSLHFHIIALLVITYPGAFSGALGVISIVLVYMQQLLLLRST
ncbi:hypothetical protein EDD21DRAFT_355967 [Dissophora ornata]|nr:hypothetical protein EDD21DRAFT_355967 [Dissophora ornata]